MESAPLATLIKHPVYGPVVQYGIDYENEHNVPCFEYLNEILHFILRFQCWNHESLLYAAMKGLSREDLCWGNRNLKALKFVVRRLLGLHHGKPDRCLTLLN